MNIFSRKFWHHFSQGWKKNPITDFVGDYLKESGLQTEAEDQYQKAKHTDPNTILEREHELGDKINHSGDNSDLADAATNAAVDGAIEAGTDAATEGAILEEKRE